jgi:hypothetical protein
MLVTSTGRLRTGALNHAPASLAFDASTCLDPKVLICWGTWACVNVTAEAATGVIGHNALGAWDRHFVKSTASPLSVAL